MKTILRFKDENSDNFWKIETLQNELSISYGKWNSLGRTNIKSFDSPEKCQKEAEKLITSKMKKGYSPTNEFDEINRKYVDVPQYGPHVLTSHPLFREYFSDKIYYDSNDDSAPFGGSIGNEVTSIINENSKKYPNDALDYWCMQEIIKNRWNTVNIIPMSTVVWREFMQDFLWELPYLPPILGQSDEHLRKMLKRNYGAMSGEELMSLFDRVMISSALGMIRNRGNQVKKTLIDIAFMSINRIEQIQRVSPDSKIQSISKYTDIIRNDLQKYTKDRHFRDIPTNSKPEIYQKSDGELLGVFPILESVDTIIPISPEEIIQVQGQKIINWNIIFVGISDNKIIGAIPYSAFPDSLSSYVKKKNKDFVRIKGLDLKEIYEILETAEGKSDFVRTNDFDLTEIYEVLERDKKNTNIIIPQEDKIFCENVKSFFGKDKYTVHTLGNVRFTTGCVAAADPICYMQNPNLVPFSKNKVPKGEYPIELSIADKRIMGARIKISSQKAILYKPLEAYIEENGEKKEYPFSGGFLVESGMAAICDKSSVQAYWDFLNDWYKKNPEGNIYDDYFASYFAESYKQYPELQRESGDFILWTVPQTDLNIPMFASGFGDGLYTCHYGFSSENNITELVIIFTNP